MRWMSTLAAAAYNSGAHTGIWWERRGERGAEVCSSGEKEFQTAWNLEAKGVRCDLEHSILPSSRRRLGRVFLIWGIFQRPAKDINHEMK